MTNAHGLSAQVEYWNRVGPTKSLAHPVNIAQLTRWAPPPSRILDYGCGYGRALGILTANGYSDLLGVDPAPGMIAAARDTYPSISFAILDDYRSTGLLDASVDAVLLFAVLTAVPTDEGQRAIIAEITRLLRPKGLLYISDMWLQTDARNIERYVEGKKKYGIYGVFDLPEGVTVRHHERSWIDSLTKQYEVVGLDEIQIHTMNGNPATAFQWFALR